MAPERSPRGAARFEDVEGRGAQGAVVEGGEDVRLDLEPAAPRIDEDRGPEDAVAGEAGEQPIIRMPRVSAVSGMSATRMSVRARKGASPSAP